MFKLLLWKKLRICSGEEGAKVVEGDMMLVTTGK